MQIRNIAAKQSVARTHNSKHQPRTFIKEDLEWRMARNARKRKTKNF